MTKNLSKEEAQKEAGLRDVAEQDSADQDAELSDLRLQNDKINHVTNNYSAASQIVNTVVLEASEDPFDLVNAPGQNLIVIMRLYDVLMGLYAEQSPEKATALIELHNSGRLLLEYPKLNL